METLYFERWILNVHKTGVVLYKITSLPHLIDLRCCPHV